MQRPLGGLLVVDLTRYLPGAFATSELLRLGARVVRVEQPGGDPMRATSPDWHDALNAGKESVVCDLPAEGAFARALLARADVILESFRPGVAARLGVKPDVIYHWAQWGHIPSRRSHAGRLWITFTPTIEQTCLQRITRSYKLPDNLKTQAAQRLERTAL